jgi:hypothetical protein
MTQKNLPAPPEFPVTFASYSSTAHKMYKAALNAATAEAAVLAVSAISAHVKGINTYAKKVRKYASELVTALSQPEQPVPAFHAYSSVSNAKRAVKAAGLDPALFNFVPAEKGKVVPAAKSELADA